MPTVKIHHPKLLKRLDQLAIELRVDHQPDKEQRLVASGARLSARLPDELRALIRRFRDELIEDLYARAQVCRECREAIEAAAVWLELETALARAQEAYQAGLLTRAQVEDLAVRAQQHAHTIPSSWEDATVSEYARQRGGSFKINARGVGEIVVTHKENYHQVVREAGNLVIFTTDELAALHGVSPEQLRSIFAAKKAMDGEVIEIQNEQNETGKEKEE